MRVLIAEDDPDIASGLCASLRRQGHVVDHVDNGAHADAALGSTQYALLVLDLGLPQLDGRDVLQRLRQRGDGLAVLAVAIGEDPTLLRNFVDEKGLTYAVLMDEDGRVSRQYKVRAIPASFFIDPQGVIQVHHVGALAEELLTQYLEKVQ